MDADATPLIPRAFDNLPDPRAKNHRHLLRDILTIAILAVIAGADGWSEVAHYGNCKKEWLKTFLCPLERRVRAMKGITFKATGYGSRKG